MKKSEICIVLNLIVIIIMRLFTAGTIPIILLIPIIRNYDLDYQKN